MSARQAFVHLAIQSRKMPEIATAVRAFRGMRQRMPWPGRLGSALTDAMDEVALVYSQSGDLLVHVVRQHNARIPRSHG
jgi:hypothetical protein